MNLCLIFDVGGCRAGHRFSGVVYRCRRSHTVYTVHQGFTGEEEELVEDPGLKWEPVRTTQVVEGPCGAEL